MIRKLLKSHIILSVFFMYYVSIENVNAQIDSIKFDINKKYIIWFSPTKARVTHVYGIMFNFFPNMDLVCNDGICDVYEPAYKIYGLDLNLNPLALLATCTMLPVHVIFGFRTIHGAPDLSEVDSINFSQFNRINGLQIGSINAENIVNGLDLSAACFDSNNNGVCISIVMNRHYVMNGITIAAIANHDMKCNGIQISLINTSKQLKGVQIGLWNINQKRSLPFINWCF